MKCSYCGAPIEKGRVFCLNCGEEIQWVPEYHPISSYRANREDAESTRDDDLCYQPIDPRKHVKPKVTEKSKKRRTPFLIGCLISLLALAFIWGLKGYMDHRNYNSYDYQFSMAETNYSNHEYETALEFVERAIVLMPEREEGYLLKAQILHKQENAKQAEQILLQQIENNPKNTVSYGLLIQIYEDESDYDSLKELIVGISDENVKKRYHLYTPVEVDCSKEAGTYDELITVELYSQDERNCTIYYTVDGSDPLLMRNVYQTEIVLEEGMTTIRAVAVNEKNIVGEVKSYTYEIELPIPEVPVIMPMSGEYDSSTKSQITVEVPEGCTAYYSFDEKPTTACEVYVGPIDMLEGEHTFYVMLVNEYGKESYPGSATYVLKEEIS